MGRYAEVNGVALGLAGLRADSAVLASVDDDPGRIDGRVREPYPRYKISGLPSPGSALSYTQIHDLQVAVIGNFDGSDGDQTLRDMCALGVDALVALTNKQYTDPTEPVIFRAECTVLPNSSPELGGHPRFVATVRLGIHPGRVPATP